MFMQVTFLCLSFALRAFAGEPVLTISTPQQKKVYRLSQLLQRKDLETLIIEDDPAYSHRHMKYRAIKVTRLFFGLKINKNAVILFTSTDGFSAPLPLPRLLNRSKEKAVAYIAIEPPSHKWPPLGKGKPSAGPFYLVWKNPKASQISVEEWPFMLANFKVQPALNLTYPNIFPDKHLPTNGPITRGFEVFMNHCFACHTLNGSGSAHFGPDLNIPLNPTEYLKPYALKKLIRNPQSVRYWPKANMKGFTRKEMSNKEIDFVIAYLQHMSKRKVSLKNVH